MNNNQLNLIKIRLIQLYDLENKAIRIKELIDRHPIDQITKDVALTSAISCVTQYKQEIDFINILLNTK